MYVLDLFSGIGGFSLGLEAAGFHTRAFCEIEPYCQKVLRKHWPDVPIHSDITKLDGKQFAGTVDVVCGGYPCQPFSTAGQRGGAEDQRHLWPEMLRIIQGSRPRWVIAENVYGHVSLGFDEVAASLESNGFTVWPLDIYSCAAGLPTVERHIWIVAKADGERQQGGWKEKVQNKPQMSWQFPRSDQRDFKRWHLPTARVCGVGERVSRRLDRLKSLGNAVPPIMPFIIGEAIMKYEANK